ncbi:hypothetical protein DPMN_011790 [Dreissena polymorpha]|uniref:Uncharacterized protein n=1 Tax=Dreissena polymorpha TaxID=45954 RepID=A0A9D4N4P6_DREPO|nr:hypothetical protein DPMN_011790 [Dreissena polymorpha]
MYFNLSLRGQAGNLIRTVGGVRIIHGAPGLTEGVDSGALAAVVYLHGLLWAGRSSTVRTTPRFLEGEVLLADFGNPLVLNMISGLLTSISYILLLVSIHALLLPVH